MEAAQVMFQDVCWGLSQVKTRLPCREISCVFVDYSSPNVTKLFVTFVFTGFIHDYTKTNIRIHSELHNSKEDAGIPSLLVDMCYVFMYISYENN